MSQKRAFDPYLEMVKHSSHLWHVVSDARGPWLLSPTKAGMEREAMIDSITSIPCYTPRKLANGFSEMGPESFWSREKAERSIGNYGVSETAKDEAAD